MNGIYLVVLLVCVAGITACVTWLVCRYKCPMVGKIKFTTDPEQDGFFAIEFTENPLDVPEGKFICFRVTKD